MSPTARPILFSAAMVRALLSGAKTQTRRVVKPQPQNLTAELERVLPEAWEAGFIGVDCPYGAPGDLLYVREAWKPHSTYDQLKPRDVPISKVFFRADERYAPSNTPWKPGIHMPRWASRLTLEITDVRVERLNDISEADSLAEGVVNVGRLDGEPWGHCHVPGVTRGYEADPSTCFSTLWETINGDGSWAENQWVWAISFKAHRQNVDQFIGGTNKEEAP